MKKNRFFGRDKCTEINANAHKRLRQTINIEREIYFYRWQLFLYLSSFCACSSTFRNHKIAYTKKETFNVYGKHRKREMGKEEWVQNICNAWEQREIYFNWTELSKHRSKRKKAQAFLRFRWKKGILKAFFGCREQIKSKNTITNNSKIHYRSTNK